MSEPTPSADDVVTLFHLAAREIAALPDRLLERRGLSRAQHRMLFLCRKHDGLTVSELLALLDVTKQAAHAPLQKLIELGYVESKPDRKDRRTRRLRLTTTGKALERQLSEPQRRALEDALANESKRDARAWARVMKQIAGER